MQARNIWSSTKYLKSRKATKNNDVSDWQRQKEKNSHRVETQFTDILEEKTIIRSYFVMACILSSLWFPFYPSAPPSQLSSLALSPSFSPSHRIRGPLNRGDHTSWSNYCEAAVDAAGVPERLPKLRPARSLLTPAQAAGAAVGWQREAEVSVGEWRSAARHWCAFAGFRQSHRDMKM